MPGSPSSLHPGNPAPPWPCRDGLVERVKLAVARAESSEIPTGPRARLGARFPSLVLAHPWKSGVSAPRRSKALPQPCPWRRTKAFTEYASHGNRIAVANFYRGFRFKRHASYFCSKKEKRSQPRSWISWVAPKSREPSSVGVGSSKSTSDGGSDIVADSLALIGSRQFVEELRCDEPMGHPQAIRPTLEHPGQRAILVATFSAAVNATRLYLPVRALFDHLVGLQPLHDFAH
jgi:hypothetical protein